MNFGEKDKEMGLPVVQTGKYKTSKAAAEKLIKDKDFISEADFWILMNKNKDKDKMLYTGLIISHNGCLKINDNIPDEKKFKPECVSVNESGYGGSLVYSYCCPSQGLYEVGEVSKANCQNAYPYAMAYKRLFDRVVLKNCKLAFYGIYSDSEAEEFKKAEPEDDTPIEVGFDSMKPADKQPAPICEVCGKPIPPMSFKVKGEVKEYTPQEWAKNSVKKLGLVMCNDCMKAADAK